MSLSAEEREVMVALEIERATRIMNEVPIYVNAQLWNTLANRLYYAAFHAVSAVFIKNEIPVKSHKGAILMFNRDYVKTGIVSKEDGILFSQLENLRESGDYNCYIETTEEQIIPFVTKTKDFIQKNENFDGAMIIFFVSKVKAI